MLPVSSDFLPALIDSLPDAVVIIDGQGRVIACNPAAAALFGYAREDVLGQPINALIAAPCRSGRADGRRRDGSAFPCELVVSEFAAGGERYATGVVRPLGEREPLRAAGGESRLRTIVDSLAALVAVYSTDGVMLDVNQAALDAGGVARADAVGQRIDRTPWVAHSPETAARALEMVHQAAAGQFVRGELDIQVAGGAIRYLDVILGPLRDPSGAVVEVLTSGIDSTERRGAEQEVQRRLRQQEAVARLGALALKTRDLPTLLTTAVDLTRDVLGGDRCTVALEIDPRVQAPPVVRDEAGVRGLSAVIDGRHGSYGILAADAQPPHVFRDDDALFLQSVANVLADVVRHAQTETQLQREREFSETIFESLPGLIALADEQGRLVRWNAALERLTGYDHQTIGRTPMLDFLPEDERPLFASKMRDVFTLGHATAEGHVRSRGGELTPMLFSARRIVLEGRPHLLGVAIDISDRRRLEEQLRHSQKMEALGQLAGGVAHDFNNLLTVISGFAGLTSSQLPPDDPNRENLDEITTAAESAAALTRQLLAFSRRTMLEPVVLDLNAVVGDMETMLRRLLGEDVRLETELADDLRHVRGDVGLLGQVLMNLAVNARDAMPLGGRLTIATRNLDVDAAYARSHSGIQPGPHAVLVIADTGTGMPPEVQAKAFEPFFTTKGTGRGTGLGLAVVHGIVEQIGASIDLESRVGAGTTFTIAFPAADDEPLPRGPAGGDALDGTGTILLVEDEEGVRRLARLILERHGYTVLEAANGEEAVRRLERHAGGLDLVVTDVVMPGIDGRAVAEAVQQRFPRAAVLFLSGYTSDAVVRHGILHHEVAFLQKPFSAASLASKVRDALRRDVG